MFKKMVHPKKIRHVARATPDANGRAIDFDQKNRRKRTRANAKMRRATARDALTLVGCRDPAQRGGKWRLGGVRDAGMD
jgi:hypothetical protein